MLNIELIKTRGEVYMMDDTIIVLTDVDAKHYRKGRATGRYMMERAELVDDIEEARMMLDMQGYIQL